MVGMWLCLDDPMSSIKSVHAVLVTIVSLSLFEYFLTRYFIMDNSFQIAPLIISECMDEAKCTPLALFHIFSMCDRFSIALLTTNLPPLQKARFAHLCPEFTKINKAIV